MRSSFSAPGSLIIVVGICAQGEEAASSLPRVKGPPVVLVAALWAAAVILMVAGMLDEHP